MPFSPLFRRDDDRNDWVKLVWCPRVCQSEKVSVNESEYNNLGYPGAFVFREKDIHWRLAFPSAEKGYSLSIAGIVNRITWNHRQDKNNSVDYWMKKFLSCQEWYGMNSYMTSPEIVIRDYYMLKHEDLLASEGKKFNHINLLYGNFNE